VTDDHAVAVDEISAWNRSSSSWRNLARGVRERMLSAAAGNPLALMALPAALEAIQLAEATLLPESLPVTAWLERAFAAPVSELPALDPGLPS
jgi:hypothetical protein